MRCLWPFYCSSVCLKFGSKLGSEIAILRCLVVFMGVYVSKPEIQCFPANSAYFLTHFHQFLAKHDLRVVDAVNKAACVSTYIYCLSHSLPIAGSLYAHTRETAYVKHRAEKTKVLCKTERKEPVFRTCISLIYRVLDKIGGRQ